MKKGQFIVAVLGVLMLATSCHKPLTENGFKKKIQGTWTMSEARLNHMNHWEAMPSTEPPVVVNEDFITNPWNTDYEVIGKGKIRLVNQDEYVKVDIYKDGMLFVFENNDSLRFVK